MRFFLILSFLIMASFPAHAVSPLWEEDSTNITIYVKAQDGKFIGTSMGGAYIRVTNKMTGDILAEGKTYGETGDTAVIMAESHKRNAILVNKDTASFDFSLALQEPTMVTISTTAPLAQPQSMVSSSQDALLLPGKDYSAENGIIVTMPGMVVDVLTPMANQKITVKKDKPVTLIANVTKLCGCTIEEGSLWPPENYDVEATLFYGTVALGTFPMKNVGPSQFATQIALDKPGTYSATITAFDKKTREGGFDKTTFVINAPEETKTTKKKDQKKEK